MKLWCCILRLGFLSYERNHKSYCSTKHETRHTQYAFSWDFIHFIPYCVCHIDSSCWLHIAYDRFQMHTAHIHRLYILNCGKLIWAFVSSQIHIGEYLQLFPNFLRNTFNAINSFFVQEFLNSSKWDKFQYHHWIGVL